MNHSLQSSAEQRIEKLIGQILRTGVLLAATVAVVGAAIYLHHHGAEAPNYRFFHSEPADFRTPRGIFHDALEVKGKGIILAGMLILIATPVARVVFAMFAFVWLKDRLYTVISLMVLAVLLFSLLGR